MLKLDQYNDSFCFKQAWANTKFNQLTDTINDIIIFYNGTHHNLLFFFLQLFQKYLFIPLVIIT